MRRAAFVLPLLAGVFLAAGVSHANKSGVGIEVPEKASKGSEITVKLHVTHHGNSFLHYTEWLKVEVNGRPVEKWEFSATNRPESEEFTRTFTVTVEGPLEIVSEASCNIHGSKGPARANVAITEEARGAP